MFSKSEKSQLVTDKVDSNLCCNIVEVDSVEFGNEEHLQAINDRNLPDIISSVASGLVIGTDVLKDTINDVCDLFGGTVPLKKFSYPIGSMTAASVINLSQGNDAFLNMLAASYKGTDRSGSSVLDKRRINIIDIRDRTTVIEFKDSEYDYWHFIMNLKQAAAGGNGVYFSGKCNVISRSASGTGTEDGSAANRNTGEATGTGRSIFNWRGNTMDTTLNSSSLAGRALGKSNCMLNASCVIKDFTVTFSEKQESFMFPLDDLRGITISNDYDAVRKYVLFIEFANAMSPLNAFSPPGSPSSARCDDESVYSSDSQKYALSPSFTTALRLRVGVKDVEIGEAAVGGSVTLPLTSAEVKTGATSAGAALLAITHTKLGNDEHESSKPKEQSTASTTNSSGFMSYAYMSTFQHRSTGPHEEPNHTAAAAANTSILAEQFIPFGEFIGGSMTVDELEQHAGDSNSTYNSPVRGKPKGDKGVGISSKGKQRSKVQLDCVKTLDIPLRPQQRGQALRLMIRGACDLLTLSKDKTPPSAYCIVYLLNANGEKLTANTVERRTSIVNKDCNPTWECEILLQKEETEDEMGEVLDAGAAAVFVKVRDASSGHLKHAHLGQVSIPLGCFIDQVPADLTLPLEPTYRMLQNTQEQLGEIMVTTELVSIRDSIKSYRNSFERKRSNSFGGGSPRKLSVDRRDEEEPKLQAVTVNYCLRITSPYEGWWPTRVLINSTTEIGSSHFPLLHHSNDTPTPYVWYELSLGYNELVIRLSHHAPNHESTTIPVNATHTGQLKSSAGQKLRECMESSDHPEVAAAFALASYAASSDTNAAAEKLSSFIVTNNQDTPVIVRIPWTQVMTCAAATDSVALLHITVHILSTNGPSPTSGHTHTPTSPDEHQVSYVPVAVDLLVAPCPADKLTKVIQDRRNLYMVRQELVRWILQEVSASDGNAESLNSIEGMNIRGSPLGVNDIMSPNVTTAEEEVRLLSLARPIAAALESLTSSAPSTRSRPLSTAIGNSIDNTPRGGRYMASPSVTAALALPLSPISVDYDCNSMSTAGRHSTALIARAKLYFAVLRFFCRHVCANGPQLSASPSTMLLQPEGKNEQSSISIKLPHMMGKSDSPSSSFTETFTMAPFKPSMSCAFDIENIELLIQHDLNDFSDMAPDAAHVLKNAVSLATDNAPSTPTSKHKPTPAELIAKNAKNKSAVDAIIAAANASGTFNQSMSLLDSSTIVLHIEHIIDRAAGRIRDFIICSSSLWCPATDARNVSTLLTPGYRCLEQLITGYYTGVINILNIFLQSKESLLSTPGEELRNGLMKFVLHKNMCFHDAIKGLIRPLGLAFQPTLSLYTETHVEQLIYWYGTHMIQSVKSWLVKTIQNAWTEKDKSHSLPWDVVLVANKYISTLPEVFRRQLNIFLDLCSGYYSKELTIDDVTAVGHELHEVLSSDSFESGGDIDNTAEEWKYLLLLNEKIISAAVRSLVLLADEYERALQSKRWAVGSDIEVADNMTFLVSVVNDTCRLKTIHVYPLLHIPVQSLSTVNHVRMVIDAYSALHKITVSHIVKLMFADLKSILVDFLNVWSATGKRTDIVGTIVATLADYFRDLRKGLEQNSYIQIVFQCCDTCTVRYLLFIKEKADTNVKFTEGELERVQEDINRLVFFYETLIDEAVADGWLGSEKSISADITSKSPLHCFLRSEYLHYLMDVKELLSLPHDDHIFTTLLRKLGKRYATNELRIVVANLLTSCVITLRPDSDLELIQAVASLLGTGSDVANKDTKPTVNPYPFIDVTLKQIDYAALSTETVMSASTVVRPSDLFVRVFRDEEDIKNNIAFEDTKSPQSTPMKAMAEKHGFSKHKNMASTAMKNLGRGISMKNVKENLKSFTPQARKVLRRPSETFEDDDVRSTVSSVNRESDAGSVGQQSVFSARLKLFSTSLDLASQSANTSSTLVEKSMVIEISDISLRGLVVSASPADGEWTGKRNSLRSSMRFLAGGSSGTVKSADPIPLKCNPYCSVTLVPIGSVTVPNSTPQLRHKTSVQWDVTEAHWNNMSLRFTISSSNITNASKEVEDFDLEDYLANGHALHIEVYDKNRYSRKVFLGAVTVKLSGIDVHSIESWFALSSKNDSSMAEYGHLPQQPSVGETDHQGELFVRIQKVSFV